MVAGRLAAEVLAEPGPAGADRRLRIQRLATAAVSNVTALDTVLGRLLLAAAPRADPVAIADLAFDDLDTPPAAPEAFLS